MLVKIQKYLKENNISYYIIPSDDDHQSEMVDEYYQFRKAVSHFTGSAGTLVIGQNEAYLWTDGRYFIQAGKELREGISLKKMNIDESIEDFLIDHLTEDDVLGFDGKVLSASFILNLEDKLDFEIRLMDVDLTSVWTNRPERSHEKVYLYDTKYHGRSMDDKLKELRDAMKYYDCTTHLMTTLDDICFLFNIRGNDNLESPVVLAFALITMDEATLYLQPGVYDDAFKQHFEKHNVMIKDYDEIYEDVMKAEGSLLLDLNKINFALYSRIPDDFVDAENPTQFMKCIKNDVEIENTKNAHIKDGVAVTKFMFWLKNNICTSVETEYTLAKKLESFRQQQDLYIKPSFETICAFGENGAIIHYHATKDNCAVVTNTCRLTYDPDTITGKMLMIDSGGQYLDGTTDITRTFVLGELSYEEKHAFTLVLKGWLRLMYAKFPYGTTGPQLDFIAREPLYREGLDFRHGTGHGVGHFLNVHEDPVRISPVLKLNGRDIEPFAPGMITSDEPGLYIEGKYGVRHENLLLCVLDQETEFGEFMKFEPLTMVPIDRDGIIVEELTEEEKAYLNDYHQKVHNTLLPYLTEEEGIWLEYHTAPL